MYNEPYSNIKESFYTFSISENFDKKVKENKLPERYRKGWLTK
jgi:hypothetical protein